MSYNAKNYTEQGGEVTHFGGKVVFEDGCEIEGLPAAANQADSTATTVAQLLTDFNALLAKLKSAGLMVPDSPVVPEENGAGDGENDPEDNDAENGDNSPEGQ